MRLGWLVLPAPLVEPMVEAKLYADTHTRSLDQLILADLITGHGYDRTVRAARLRYRRRRDLLHAQLRAHAPWARVSGIAAGLHALVWLPEPGPTEATVLAQAGRQGLALQPLAEHWHRSGSNPQGLIVGYSTPAEADWPAALAALCAGLAGGSTRPTSGFGS